MTNIRPYLSAKTSLLKSWQILLVLMAILILGIGAVGYRQTSRPSPPLLPDQPSPKTTPGKKTPILAPSDSNATLIYGTWEGGSTIKAINTDRTNHVVIANLPSSIKDVNVVSEHELLYIAETNDKDHGKKVNLYDLQTGQDKTLLEAAPGFGIDDLVISPNKQWLAVLEAKFAPGAKILSGGDSRVYTAKLSNPQNKILIVDEKNVSATNLLHYPLFFDSQNRLYLDTFGPNGGGWNRGLWVINSDGSGFSLVPAMNDGDYSTDPIISPNGTKIVFTGYDPAAPLQLASNPSSGILRPAIANPNLLQIIDLTTLQKTTLLGSVNGAQYGNLVWSDTQEKIAFQKSRVLNSSNSKFEGVYIYDLLAGEAKEIRLPDSALLEILGLNSEGLLWGQPTENTGNLGGKYQSTFASFSITNLSDQTTTPILTGPILQFIDVFSKPSGAALALTVSVQAAKSTPKLSLQLATFEVKPIAKIRNPQQNDRSDLPRCQDLFGLENRRTWDRSKCSDTPLYLYPEKETWVNIKVNPPAKVLYSEPVYKNDWRVLAKPNGQLTTTDGKTLNKISYLYSTPLNTLPQSGIPLRGTNSPKPPTSGLVVEKESLNEALPAYAVNLGLAGQEITDFASFWFENLPDSPYYFISHFSQEQSAAMMPLAITPQPDTLIQTIMYFKPLEEPIEVEVPVFEKIPARKGFVVVDWSGIIEL